MKKGVKIAIIASVVACVTTCAVLAFKKFMEEDDEFLDFEDQSDREYFSLDQKVEEKESQSNPIQESLDKPRKYMKKGDKCQEIEDMEEACSE